MVITDLELTQAFIEFIGAVICIAFAIILSLGESNKVGKTIRITLVVGAILLITDGCAYIFRGNTEPLSVILNRVGCYGPFICNIAFIILVMQLVYYMTEEHGGRITLAVKTIVYGESVISALFLLINAFTGFVFYFDSNNIYHRNVGWYVYAFMILLGLLAIIVHTIFIRMLIPRHLFIVLIVFETEPFVMGVVQSFIYGISLSNLGVVVGFLILLFIYYVTLGHKAANTEDSKMRRNVVIALAMTFVIIVSMGSSLLFCVYSFRDVYSDRDIQDYKLDLQSAANGLSAEISKPIVVSETMSIGIALSGDFNSGVDSDEEVEKDVSMYLDSIRRNFGYQMVFAVCDDSGKYYTYKGVTRIIDTGDNGSDKWYKDFKGYNKHYELNIDKDKDNGDELAIFVNTEIINDAGDFLGVCGTAVNLEEIQELLRKYSRQYHMHISFVDEKGMIQIDENPDLVENAYLDNSYFDKVSAGNIYCEQNSNKIRMTIYLPDFGWYLVATDTMSANDEFNRTVFPGIVIFLAGIVIIMLIFWLIVTQERKMATQSLKDKNLSRIDRLTGLLNRNAYEADCEKLEQLDDDTVLVVFDINGLKTVNDNIGHEAGDELLIGAASCMKDTFSGLGNLYRTGGDEFIAVLHTTEDEFKKSLCQFEASISKWSGKNVDELSVSQGYVMKKDYPDLGFTNLIKLADRLMYEDKNDYYRRTGRNRRAY